MRSAEMTVQPPTLERPAEAEGPTSPEVLFKEARRRRRRRYGLGAVGVAAAAGLVAALMAVFTSPPRPAVPRPSSVSKSPAAITTCTTRQLRLGLTYHGAAAEAEVFQVLATNVSGSTCEISGVPSIALLSQGSTPLSTHMVPLTSVAAREWSGKLRLAPSSRASFTVNLNEGGALPQPLPSCPVVTGMTIRFGPIHGTRATALQFPSLPPDVPPLRSYSTNQGYTCNQVYLSGVQPSG
jgi:hypothetical protein